MTDRPLPVLPPLPDDLEPTVERATDPPAAAATPPTASPSVEAQAGVEAAVPRTARRGGGRSATPPREPRERRPRRDEERRLWSAGHALVVCALALAISLLLNAPGVHKKAYNQEAGWQREVAIAFTGPLAGISDALLLDLPREGVQSAIGRSGDDEIDTAVVLAPTPQKTGDGGAKAGDGGTQTPSDSTEKPPAVKPATPAKPTKVAFTPQKKLKLWIAGDSLVITPGYAIVRAAGSTPVISGLGVDGRVATGLTRPDVFNWFDHIRTQVATLKPNVVVLAFGGNDDKAYMTGLPENVSIADFGDAAWQREYRRRVGGVFDAINRAGAHAIWIGLPQTADPEQTRRFDVVNAAVAAEARERPKTVTYLDTYTTFAGPDGGYAEYLDTPGRGSIKVRAGDGVHFERAGGDMIAREVLKALNKTYDLTSWRKQAQQS
ncbi:MAG: DUF459 domain-containing protein [Gaiella sp.]